MANGTQQTPPMERDSVDTTVSACGQKEGDTACRMGADLGLQRLNERFGRQPRRITRVLAALGG
jgi:hypothetical protein